MSKFRVGVYGGAFDPPHIGHVLAVAQASAMWNFENVFICPAFNHAHGKQMAPFDQRMLMCEAAFAHFGRHVRVAPIEEQNTEGYTWNVLQFFDTDYQEAVLIVGSDTDLSTWHRGDEIREKYRICRVNRGGGRLAVPDVSSTQVRAAVAEDNWDALREMVPPTVVELIQKFGLYGAA